MDEKELDLSQINQIDMECVAPDDDDLFIKPSSKVEIEDSSEERPVVTKLGIFADFSDDDDSFEVKELTPLTVGALNSDNIDQDIRNAAQGTLTPNQIDRADLTGINIIDTECSVGEDDDIDYKEAPSISRQVLDFGDEANDLIFDKELLEKRAVKSPEKQPDGSVDDDYWKDIQKKHNKANKKGMGPVHGHWCADPEAEKDMFNHDNTPHGSIVPKGAQLGVAGDGQEGSMVDGGLPSLGEDLTPTKATEKMKDLISFMDYKVVPNEEGNGYMLRDEIYHADNYSFNTVDELLDTLYRYCSLEEYLDDELRDIVENHREDIQLPLL